MTPKEAAQQMLDDFGVKCAIAYGRFYHYNPFYKFITVRAVDISIEVTTAATLHEVAHAVQHSRNKSRIIINAILRNIAPSVCKKQTLRIEREANEIAAAWLSDNAHLFPRLNIDFILNAYYPTQLKAYG